MDGKVGEYRTDAIDRKFSPKILTGKIHMEQAEVGRRVVLKQTLKLVVAWF
jgi:hypothetical protein